MRTTFGWRIGWIGVAAALLAFGLQTLAARADIYAFDRDHTNITFSWNHLGIARQSARIMEFDGILDFDPENPENSSVDVTLKVASLFTGTRSLDRDLKSSDFFDAARYPEITFKSAIIRRVGERSGEVTGDLTILGTTHPVALQVRWNFSGEHPLGDINPAYKGKYVAGFSAVTTVLRSAWGLKRAVPLVSDEIEVTIEAEFLRK
ncbi:MAG: YceI family protein [Hyphomicrobiaceae bacterium]